jgi:glycine/D-amino acid oxidase-like deaminating enzyme
MGYDVVVIGGGVAGSLVAMMLVRRGYRVVLVDCWGLGGRASSLSLGIVSPAASPRAHELRALATKCNPRPYRRTVVVHLAAKDYAPRGRTLDVSEARDVLGFTPKLADGEVLVLDPKGFIINVDTLAQCLAKEAVAEGLRVVEGRRARLLIRDGRVQGVVLEGSGRVEARLVVNAGGGWMARIAGARTARAVLAAIEPRAPARPGAALVDHAAGLRLRVDAEHHVSIAYTLVGEAKQYSSLDPSAHSLPATVAERLGVQGRPLAYVETAVVGSEGYEPVNPYGVVNALLPGLSGLSALLDVASRAVKHVEAMFEGAKD